MSTGAIILERAPGGSIDCYLRRKHEQLRSRQDANYEENFGPDIEYECPYGETGYYDAWDGVSTNSSSTKYEQLNTGQTVRTEVTTVNSSSYGGFKGETEDKSTESPKRNWIAWKLEVLWQVATALQYLRSRCLYHGKIKASNILLFTDGPINTPQPQVKISDPGVVHHMASKHNSGEYSREMDLPPPWIPIEYISSQVEKFPLCYDNWSYATLVAEIGQWCYKSFKMSVPLSRPDKDRYCTKRVRDLPTWIEDLNPKLHQMIRECWNPEPTLRPSFSDLLRELAIARVIARETDKTLNLELPSSADAMDDYMSVSTYQDMALTTVKQLGQGHFGVVELCSHDNSSNSVPHRSELVAVKSLRDNMRSVQNTSDFRNEFDIWREFDHKNIVKLLGLSLPSGRLVMEYIENGSLFSWLSHRRKEEVPFDSIFEQLFAFSVQICEGMEYIHSKGKIHRDLAARNVMVASQACSLDPDKITLVAKISDFGLSRRVDATKTYYRGNPEEFPVQWYAPECIKDQSYHYTSDVWSFGVTLWEIFSYGQRPEYKNAEKKSHLTLVELFNALQEGCRLPKPLNCPMSMFEIVRSCWAFKHEDRPTFTTLLGKLQKEEFSSRLKLGLTFPIH